MLAGASVSGFLLFFIPQVAILAVALNSTDNIVRYAKRKGLADE